MPISITNRDVAILAELGEHGVLTAEMIRYQHFPNDKTGEATRRRLKLLREQGLIIRRDRPGKSAAHFLAPAGAELVDHHLGCLPPRICRSEPKLLTLEHRIEMVEVRRCFDAACKQQGLSLLTWIHEEDAIDGPSPTGSPSDRMILQIPVEVNRRTMRCRPDAACCLRVPLAQPQDDRTHKHYVLYWELDRATGSNFPEKMGPYAAFLASGKWRDHWTDLNQGAAVRVLTVCPSQERIGNICKDIRQHKISEWFRFSIKPELTPESILTKQIWQTIDGKLRSILRQKSSLDYVVL